MSTKFHLMTICIIASLLLSGCGSAPVSPQATAQPEATGNPSPAPSVMPPLNPTFPSTPIFTPVPTPIPTLPALQFGKTISPENTGEIIELARRGKGVVTSMSFTSDGKKIIVGASRGIYLYDALTREQVGYIKEDWPSLVTCSPDGKTLAFWAADGSIKIWDLVGDKEILTLIGQKDFITLIRFSPDGKTLATGSQRESDTSGGLDLTVKLWDISNGKELSTLKGTIPSVGGYFYPVFNLAFLPDGKTLIYGGGSELKLWDVQNSQELRTLSLDVGLDDAVVTYALSPDGKTLAIATLGSFVFWDINTGKIVQTIRSDRQSSILKLVFSPDGKMLVMGGGYDYSIDEQKVILLDIAAARELHTFEKESANIFAISPDGKTLSTLSNTGNIELRDVYSGQTLGTLTGYEIPNSDQEVIISPDGKMLISRTGSVAKLWDLATGEQGAALLNINEFSSSMDFSPDSKLLAYINYDEEKIIIWDVSNNQELQTFSNTPSPRSIAFSPDGKMLAVGCSAATILLRDAKNGNEIAHLESTGSWDYVAFSPDGKILATTEGGFSKEILLWDVAKKEKLLTITDDDSYWENMVFSPDSKLLATAAGVDEKIVVWNVSNGRQLFTVTKKGSAAVAFSPDGKILAYGSGTTMVMRDVVNQKELNTFDHLTGEVLSISFSPDGKSIATGVSDGTIGIWGIAP